MSKKKWFPSCNDEGWPEIKWMDKLLQASISNSKRELLIVETTSGKYLITLALLYQDMKNNIRIWAMWNILEKLQREKKRKVEWYHSERCLRVLLLRAPRRVLFFFLISVDKCPHNNFIYCLSPETADGWVCEEVRHNYLCNMCYIITINVCVFFSIQ